jgi:hypothetical protein
MFELLLLKSNRSWKKNVWSSIVIDSCVDFVFPEVTIVASPTVQFARQPCNSHMAYSQGFVLLGFLAIIEGVSKGFRGFPRVSGRVCRRTQVKSHQKSDENDCDRGVSSA